MKNSILLLCALAIYLSSFSQTIVDQHVIPYPRLEGNTMLIIKSAWANMTCNVDSYEVIPIGINVDTILVNGYYNYSMVTMPCLAIDTFDISAYATIQVRNIKFVLYAGGVAMDSINHRVIISPLSTIQNQSLENSFTIFPNPTNNYAYIDFDLSKCSDVAIQLFDNQGKLLKKNNYTSLQYGSHSLQFCFSGIENGIYILQILSNDRIINRRIIKQ